MNGKPKVGFLGVGGIGRARLEAVCLADCAEIVAIADPSAEARNRAAALVPGAVLGEDLDALLKHSLDALVIATPSGAHAAECVRAFGHGLSVFCQKPLGTTAAEVKTVVAAAKSANRRLGVDFSYRETRALVRLRELVQNGELGRVHTIDLTFHNAYGPPRGWADDLVRSGGGCLMDLGVHLLDAAFWILGGAKLSGAVALLTAEGVPLRRPPRQVEDFVSAQILLENGTALRLACSWRSSFGNEADIRVACFGTRASAAFENVAGSFYDFQCELYRGKERVRLVDPPDAWGGRALVRFLETLGSDSSYRPDPCLLDVASALDTLYGRGVEDSVVRRQPQLASGVP
jgi:predicted dehydrogenase